MHRAVLLIAITIALISGCKTTESKPTASPSNPPPSWVTGDPKIKGMYCAVGTSEPTFYKEDAKKTAAQNARTQLASTLSTEIKSVMLDVTTNRGSNVEKADIVQVSSWSSDLVVEKSEIQGYWYDAEGSYSSGKNITYALACIPASSVPGGIK